MEKLDKKRSPNYTQREKEILVSLVEKYFKVIENKKTNLVFNKQKNECWEKLAWEYNSLQMTVRTGPQLKSCYEQMKKIVKQHKAEDKVDLLKTGGGTFNPKTTALDDKILILLKYNYFTIPNKYDSNKEPIMFKPDFATSSISSGNANCADNEENIYLVYEDDDQTQINDDQLINDSMMSIGTEIADTLEIENITEQESMNLLLGKPKKIKINNVALNPLKENLQNEPSAVQEVLKRKVSTKQSTVNEINIKKLEVYNLKIKVLNTNAETELEHLKGAKLDEIKELIKEKEIINLKLKKESCINSVLFLM